MAMLSRQVVVVRIPPPLQPPPLPGAAMRQGQECTSKRPARHDCISGRLVQAAGWAFVRRNFRTRVKTAQHSSTGGHRHPEHASCHCHLPATDPIASSRFHASLRGHCCALCRPLTHQGPATTTLDGWNGCAALKGMAGGEGESRAAALF